MSSTGWKVGDVYQVGDFVGLIGDATEHGMSKLIERSGIDPIFKGNLVTSDPEYLIKLLGLEMEEE